MKEKMSKEFLHIPVYGWLAGVGALVLALLYFKSHKSSASSASTGTGTTAQPGSYPQNIYSSTNVYSQTGSVPGANAGSPAPTSPFVSQSPPNTVHGPRDNAAPLAVSNGAPTPLMQGRMDAPGLPPAQPIGSKGLPGVVSQGGGSAALMPAPVNSTHWTPRMNSDIFGQGAGGPSPVAPGIFWNMTPTAAYTQN